ncbi:MAG: hypothetical protein HRT89_03325 [Lentisphaeria bacterium]|nr:hypothetical protein [Lentisphaeria bacterium]NQZ67082.1 hypothetical protein [Lentisphaeria bacterium]
MDLKFIIPIAISAILMFWGQMQYKTKGKDWGRPLAGIFAIICCILAISSVLYSTLFKDQLMSKSYMDKHVQYLNISHTIFGKHVAEKQAGMKAIIIYPKPSSNEQGQKMHQASIETFKTQISGKIEIVDSYEWDSSPKTGGPEEGPGMGMETILTAEIFEEILSDFSDYDLIISFIGLPEDFKSLKYWAEEYDGEIPKFVLINSAAYEFKPGIMAGHFVSILHNKPIRFDFEAPIPKDPQVAFDARYIIITPENIQALEKEISNLFQKEE